jgi:hypothetical protein
MIATTNAIPSSLYKLFFFMQARVPSLGIDR